MIFVRDYYTYKYLVVGSYMHIIVLPKMVVQSNKWWYNF